MNMTVKKLNDAPVLDQIESIGYMKFMALLVHKLAPNGVTITADDIAKFPPGGVLLSHGHYDGFEFRIVTQEEAERIAEHAATTNRSRA